MAEAKLNFLEFYTWKENAADGDPNYKIKFFNRNHKGLTTQNRMTIYADIALTFYTTFLRLCNNQLC